MSQSTHMPTTEHAHLPLWSEKNPLQKEAALTHIWHDLLVYAKIRGKSVPKLDTAGSYESRHEQLMVHYQNVLAEDITRTRALLTAYQPLDAKEAHDVAKIITLVDEHPNIFNMHCEIGHITGSALLIDPTRETTLLHLHKKLGKWLQFGGHPEYETDYSQVALRETEEETGLQDLQLWSPQGDPAVPIDIDLQYIPAHKGRPDHYHLDFRYVLTTPSLEAMPHGVTGESNEFLVTPLRDLSRVKDMVEPSLLRLMRKTAHLLDHSKT